MIWSRPTVAPTRRDCVGLSTRLFSSRGEFCCNHRRLVRSGRSVVLLLTVCLSTGCAGLRERIANRSAECTQLCEEARLAREQGQDGRAEQLLNAALKQRPTESQARFDLAEELWRSGRQIAAADVIAKMVAERPDDAPAALRLARMEYEIGRTAASESALRLALMNDPENPEGLRLQAELAGKKGDWDSALATYHHLTQINPDDLAARLAMASAHIQRGQADRAAPILRGVIQHPDATTVQRHTAELQLGISYAQVDRWEDAANCLESAVKHGSATADDWYRLAYAQARMGDNEQAYASISSALQLRPNHGGALELARSIKLDDGQPLTAVVPAGFSPQSTAQMPNERRARL